MNRTAQTRQQKAVIHPGVLEMGLVLLARRNLARGAGSLRRDGQHTGIAAGTEVLVADSMAALPWVIHGFSTRRGGPQRRGTAANAFNLGFTEGVERHRIEDNRRHFLRSVGAGEAMPLLTLRQIHSDVSHVASALPAPLSAEDSPQADAVLTSRATASLSVHPDPLIGVPVLLRDRKRHVVAAVHAGWRGTLARVVQKALGRMRLEFGTEPKDVVAAIGPSIGSCCYEVGPEVAQAFSGQFLQAREWFDGPFDRLALGEEPNPLPWLTMMPPGHEPPPERVQLDLRAANRWQLVDWGVVPAQITTSSLCTAFALPPTFSSAIAAKERTRAV